MVTKRSGEGQRLIDEWYGKTLEKWPDYQEHTVQTHLGTTYVLECGRPGAPLVVLMHGGAMNSGLWSSVIDLSDLATAFHIYAIDTIGDVGRSVLTTKLGNSLAYSDWLAEVFQALHIETPIMVGASFGATLSLQMAYTHPQLVGRVLAFVPPSVVCRMRARVILRMLWFSLFPRRERFLDFLRYLEGGQLAVEKGKDLVEFLYENARCKNRPIMAMPKRLKDADLASIRVPCTCFMAELDPFYRARQVKRRLDALDCRVRAVVLEGVGHMGGFQVDRFVAEGLEPFR